MTIFEMLSVVGLILGPVAAVIITLWAQQRLQRSDSRLSLARNLLIAQVDHSDPSWSASIRQVPVEFRKLSEVMQAWRQYIDAVNNPPSPENRAAQDSKVNGRKLDLLFEVCRATKLGLSESDIRNTSYLAKGYTDRQQLVEDAANAIVRAADALEKTVTT